MDASLNQIADYAHALQFSDLPPKTVRHCIRCIVDTLGCALGGMNSEPSRIARELALRAGMANGARVFGTAHRTLPEVATFANGTMARYLDGNDLFAGGGGHPSNTLSAILAAADVCGADGKQIITATALAYEIYFNLYKSTDAFLKGIDHAYYTAVAGAAGAARIMGLARVRIRDAVSLAASANIAVSAVRYGHLSLWKGCSEANGSRNGMFAALLAAAGMTGPDHPFEGGHSLANLIGKFELQPFARAGEPYKIDEVAIKCYLVVAHGLPLITVALPLSQQVAFEDIVSVTMHTYKFARDVTGSEREKWRPSTREAADHSLPYILAAVLVDRAFSDAAFSEEHLRDPRIRELIDKIEIREDPELTRRFPNEMPCRIEIKLKNGEIKVGSADNPRGHDKNPMTDAEISVKFRMLAHRVMPSAQAERLLAAAWQLESAANLDAVFDAMRLDG